MKKFVVHCVRMLVLLVALLLPLALPRAALATRYVFVKYIGGNTAAPSNSNPGSSWDNAYAYLQSGLVRAHQMVPTATDPIEVWVTQGTYYPDDGYDYQTPTPQLLPNNDRTLSFRLESNVAVRAGFIGTEPVTPLGFRTRSPYTNLTILSGDLTGNDNQSDLSTLNDNSHHVVSAISTVIDEDHGVPVLATAILDGFIVTRGNANNSEITNVLNRVGGGLYLSVTGGTPTSHHLHGNLPTILRCRFELNRARDGGAVYAGIPENSQPAFLNCEFFANRAADNGGAMFVRGTTCAGVPKFVNCLFHTNFAEGAVGDDSIGRGGAIYLESGCSLTMKNCTLSNNNGTNGGAGGIHHMEPCPTGPARCMSTTIYSSIIYDNTSPQLVGSHVIDYCIIPSLSEACNLPTGHQNLTSNPVFVGSGNYRLQASSPAIDTGYTADIEGQFDLFDANQDANVLEALPDLALRFRIVGSYVTSGSNNCHVVDRGAYEYAAPRCRWDIAPQPGGDGNVGVADLLAVITAWGPCPAVPTTCLADIAPITSTTPCADQTVGVADLLAIINYWGPCGVPGAPMDEGNLAGMPQTVQDCLNMCAPLGVGTPEYVNCVTKCTNALP